MAASSNAWKGEGMTQEDFMYKDECIVLDENDAVTGHANKYDCHRFNESEPRGILHRAFSVFLFDSKNRLLLQQRAQSKITFPSVWTNTCCSHPLYGFEPTEVDTPADLQAGTVPGVKRAAIRKLEHELGIPASQVPIEKFKFMTRMHYWAADTVTHGPESEWGEHEIDYVLLIKADVTVKPNAEEVDAVRYVTLDELRDMMKTNSGLLWSPWFRIIVERFLPAWWSDLDVTLSTDKHLDTKTIHRFDPPAAHMGGKGKAGPYLGSGLPAGQGELKKQGAYGKIKTHSESLVSQLLRVGEVTAALRVKFFSPFKSQKFAEKSEDLAFCDDILGSVSRSFAAVIRQLPSGLCVEVVVFYLVLRALDTVEDDMEAFADDPSVKVKHLQDFYETALEDPTWCMTGVGKGDEALLLEQFYRVVRVFKSLAPGMQAVIKDITRQMGAGMAEFVSKDLGQGTVSLAEYDKYCHYVAGLVGEGLTRMFAESGLEDKELAARSDLSNSMGLFLQKTNIIRDYLEDYIDGRAFWPQEVWKLYSVTGSLGDFAQLKHREKALQCLNHLVTNALVHMPDCLEYLSRLHTPEVFKFCAIPQVMAIATLDKVFNNEDVFTGVVKIRKGLACKLILESSSMDEVYACFRKFATNIASRVNPSDPNASRTLSLCRHVVELCMAKERRKTFNAALLVNVTVVPAVLAACAYYLRSRGPESFRVSSTSSTADLAVWGLLFAGVFSMLAYSTASIATGPFPSATGPSAPADKTAGRTNGVH